MDKNKFDKKKNTGKRNLLRFLPVLLLMIVMAAATAGAGQAYAGEGEGDDGLWPEVFLQPGQEYDVGLAEKNSTVHINQEGTYFLRGESRFLNILVESGNVILYLEDGLNINCSLLSNAASPASPITVGDMGGTVTIISTEGADIYLEGYLSPAIEKDGTNTKLVFETETPSSPGTITAKGGNDSAAIGGAPFLDGEIRTTGNMEFNSGNINATAGTATSSTFLGWGAAAIGGGPNFSLDGLTINGGKITAYSSEPGAAIGSGSGGIVENLVINDGEVHAETNCPARTDDDWSGAAIGSGGMAYHQKDGWTVKSLHINGGHVTALATGTSAAIGGGEGSGVLDLQINGGIVYAQNKEWSGPGIGSGVGLYNRNIYVEVKITGGYIESYGSEYAPGIGIPNKGDIGKTKLEVDISGGTIKTTSGTVNTDYAIGGPDPNSSKVVITGGSLLTCGPNDGQISGSVVNDKGEDLHKVEVTCQQIPKDGASYELADPVFSNGYAYGMKDVRLLEDNDHSWKIFPWLPATDEKLLQATLKTAFQGGTVQEDKYCGDVKFSDSTGELKPMQSMTLEELVALLPDPVTPGYALIVDAAVEALLTLQGEDIVSVSPGLLQKLAAADDVISRAKPAAKKTKLITVKNKSGKKALVKWGKTSGVTGYKIQYCANKNFRKGVKTKKVGAKVTKITLKKLKKGKTYYVKVTPYTKVTNRITGKIKTVYGKKSNVKRVKIKK